MENSVVPTNIYEQSDTASSAGSVPVSQNDEEKREINQLARQFTNLSVKRTNTSLGPVPSRVNPFIPEAELDPRLDPFSDKFNPRTWAQHVVNLHLKNPDAAPRLTAGVAFKNMGAYGYGKGSDYQKTVTNIVTSSISKVVNIRNKGTKIQILRDFNGVVKKGETCVVLGRPGR